MKHILTLGLLSLLGVTHAQTQQEFRSQETLEGEPYIEAQGHSFPTWEAYTQSELFKTLGLRCGTPPATERFYGPQSRGSQTDCSFSRTIIKAEYHPADNKVYQIPVVFHAIERTNGTGHVPDSYFHSQIEILNEDFNATAGSNGAEGTIGRFYFYLATVDPEGGPTTGIRRIVNNTFFQDGGSYWRTLNWDSNRYLNIYSNSASGNLGYVPALPQNGIVGSKSDRVVVLWSTVGRNGLGGPPYDLGRTVTHELGHYLGLEHTFSGGCAAVSNCYNNGDLICDTNAETSPNFGCPTSRSTCGTPDPFHNYMDYSDDLCMNQFTAEQTNRMRCTMENWRVALDQPECTTSASAISRNAGSNPDVLTATPPRLGEFLTFTMNTGSFTMGTILVYSGTSNSTLRGGQTLLIDPASSFIFQAGPLVGPNAEFSIDIPVDPALCGVAVSAQAILFGATSPFGLTNAVDMVAGG